MDIHKFEIFFVLRELLRRKGSLIYVTNDDKDF